jgi:hypothetical protein
VISIPEEVLRSVEVLIHMLSCNLPKHSI